MSEWDHRRALIGWVYPIKFIQVGPGALYQDAKGNWFSHPATIEYVQAGGRWRCVVALCKVK